MKQEKQLGFLQKISKMLRFALADGARDLFVPSDFFDSLHSISPMKVFGSHLKDKFEQIIQNAERYEQEILIANRFPWQSRIAIVQLLSFANRKVEPVRVITGSCPATFYKKLLPNFETCLESGCSIKLLVWKEKKEEVLSLFSSLCERYPAQLALRFSGTTEHSSIIPHFMVVGESAYRQEAAGHEDFDDCDDDFENAPEVPARISFNDPKGAVQLIGLFEALWDFAKTDDQLEELNTTCIS